MATKQISQLPSTSVSNDTDLLMTRQGSEDRAVAIDKVRNIGTEAGQSLGVGGYGIGANAIPITDLFASNNADLITRDGIYQINGAANVPVAAGEIIHTQSSATSATQDVTGENEEKYFRKKVAGVWKEWKTVETSLPEPVAGFTAARDFYKCDVTDIANPDISAQVSNFGPTFTGFTIKTLGPTGSGMDEVLDILDSVPTTAKFLEFHLSVAAQSNGTNPGNDDIDVVGAIAPIGVADADVSANTSQTVASIGDTSLFVNQNNSQRVLVEVDSSRTFKLGVQFYRVLGDWLSFGVATIYFVGYWE